MATRYLPRALPPGVKHVAMDAALRSNETLGSLLQRLQASTQRLACIAPLLPPALLTTVQAGPLDEEGWSLLVNNAASAAKLRQMLPELAAELQAHGWNDLPIRLRVQARR